MKMPTVRLLAAAAVAVMLMVSTPAANPPPSERVRWFTEARFGMFVHFGLYSILGGSWGGHTLPAPELPNGRSWYAEWAQQRLEVPRDQYRALVTQFNPVHFDADAWILEAKRAGMRYFVITAKHHDGFALWDSAVTDYDLGATPFKGDILGDLANACRKYGLKFGFYYSHWQDWGHDGGAWPYWAVDRRPTQEAFERYWQGISLRQVAELIDRYDPDLFWFDTWDDESKDYVTPKRRDELIALIRTKSPRCLVNGRICFHDPGDDIDFLETHDNQHPEKNLGRPWQTPATICRSWGWHAGDFNWKSSRTLAELLAHNVSMGGNYLLNVGPMPDGRFPAAATRRLREVGGWTDANAEAIYGASPVDATAPDGVRLTKRDLPGGRSRIYVFLTKTTAASITLPIVANRVTACHVLESGRPIPFTADGGHVSISTDTLTGDNAVPVLVIDVGAGGARGNVAPDLQVRGPRG
jgi:alpha-L-fucosidase